MHAPDLFREVDPESGKTAPPVVDVPGGTSRRRTVRLAALLLALLVVLAVADQAARAITLHRLSLAIERSEGVMLDFMEGVEEVVTSLPENPSRSDIDWALESHSSLAAGASEELRVRRRDVEAVQWFAWHTQIGRARSRYLAHTDAWLTTLSHPPEEQLSKASPSIEATWNVAADALADAVPLIDFGVGDRIEEIIRVGSHDDSGTST